MPPLTSRLPLPLQQTPVPDFNPQSIWDLLLPEVLETLIPWWVDAQLRDIARYITQALVAVTR